MKKPRFLQHNNLKYVSEHKDYFMMNDIYYSIILVTNFKNNFPFSIFNYYSRNQNIKFLLRTELSDLNLIDDLTKEYKDLERKLDSASHRKELALMNKYRDDLISLQNYIVSLKHNQDKTLDVSCAFVVRATELKILRTIRADFKSTLMNDGFGTYVPQKMQLATFKHFVPVFENDIQLNETQKMDLSFPMSTSSFAMGYPYLFTELNDPNGFLYGYEINSYGRIVFNPLLFFMDEQKAVETSRISGNIIYMGGTGSGKTTDMFLIKQWCIREQIFLMDIDPENKNKQFILDNKGSYLEFGSGDFMLNLWQLLKNSDDSEEKVDFAKLWNTEYSIINAIDTFKNVLVLYSKNINDDTLSVIDEVAIHMYEQKGITPALIPTFENLKATDFPIMSDFNNSINEKLKVYRELNDNKRVNALEDLSLKISPMINNHRHYFNGHSTLDIQGRKGGLIGIGTKKLHQVSEELNLAIHYILYSHAFSCCLDDKYISCFMFDEASTSMKNKLTLNLLDTLTRRSRKYFNFSVIGTQEPEDFDLKETRALINNSSYIIIKRLENANSVDMLKSLIGVNEEETQNIRNFIRGDSFVKAGSQRFFMHTLLTEREKMEKGGNYEEKTNSFNI